jgi:phage-related tail fiber protein
MADFYTILTNTGRSKLAAAQAAGTAVQLSHMALGDGGGSYHTPDPTQTALVNERYRNALNSVAVDPQNEFWLVCELVVPSATGGFYIREVGVFDVDGDLIAVGKYPETYKPTLADGVAKDLHIKMIFETSNAASVSISVDPSVILASKDYVDDQVAVINGNKVDRSEWVELVPGQAIKMPNGYIMQWGLSPTVAANTRTTVVFPVAFPNACVSAISCAASTNTSSAAAVNVNSYSATQITLHNSSAIAAGGQWFAIGY